MALSFCEKIKICDSFLQLRKGTIKPDKTNYYFDGSKNKRKIVVKELRDTGNGYIYAGYIKEYHDKVDDLGYINIDKYASNESEFRALLKRAITSFE